MTISESPLYLDFNATTPLDPRVFEAMKVWFLGPPTNSGSRTHIYGQKAKLAVEVAREQIAEVIGASSEEVIFTSGATESNNLVLLGIVAFGEREGRKHIISTAIEHKSVLQPLEQLRKLDFQVDLVPVPLGGHVEPEKIRQLLRPDTLLVSVMHANNETGIKQPLPEISKIVKETNAFFHTDAAQTYGKEIDEFRQLSCDFISISSHKIYGPQGIGALYIKRDSSRRCPLEPLMFGGGQEGGLRPGTLPVPLAVGFGKAASLAVEESHHRNESALIVKRQLLTDLSKVEHQVNGDLDRSQAHVLNVSFPGVDSEALVVALKKELAISNGSACTSASYSPSHVLIGMGLDEARVGGAIRFSWGPGVQRISTDSLVSIVNSLRMD